MGHFFSKSKQCIPASLMAAMLPFYHFALAMSAALWYRFPSRRIEVVGVTGTKGKTTVVELLHAILAETGAKVASVSSERFKWVDSTEKNMQKMTMPGRFFLQGFLRRAVREGCQYAVIEVTSQGIAQFRHRFIHFRAAVATHIAPEHIEAHGSFEKYLRAKLDLFWRLPREGLAVINADDPHAARFAAATSGKIAWFGKDGIRHAGEEWRVVRARESHHGLSFYLAADRAYRGETAFISRLAGGFNASNMLAAAAFGLARHIAPEKIASGIARVEGVPGRMEWVLREPFGVVVDYAHTPGSLTQVYRALSRVARSQEDEAFFKKDDVSSDIPYRQEARRGQGKLICVLGAAGGGRDKWKRPEFGRIAGSYCDTIILTNEDPYDEDPAVILVEIKAGIPARKRRFVREIPDRREAIRIAIRTAKKGDTVVLTGKGSEPWMMGSGGARMPWDDRQIAWEALRNRAVK